MAHLEGGFAELYDLEEAYEVTQVGDLYAGPRRVISAQPDNPVVNSAVRNLLVDDYAAGRFHATNGLTLPYLHFAPGPDQGRDKYPLVVTLHGYGESGTNNTTQVTGNQISVALPIERPG